MSTCRENTPISAGSCLQHLSSVESTFQCLFSKSDFLASAGGKEKLNTLLKQKFQNVGLREADGHQEHQTLPSPHRFLLY